MTQEERRNGELNRISRAASEAIGRFNEEWHRRYVSPEPCPACGGVMLIDRQCTDCWGIQS